LLALGGRSDLGEELESLLGDCCGPGSAYDTQRQHLSTYAHAHYADLDPAEAPPRLASSAVELLRRGLTAAGPVASGPVIDLGCAVGRTSLELAQALAVPVLGVDLSFAMLRVGAALLAGRGVRYPRRRGGLVYERRCFAADFSRAGEVDFWACDAGCLPLADGALALAVSLNVIDCLASPHQHLRELARVLRPGGQALVATPYDWNAAATPVEAWLGGHSQRGASGGSSEVVLRSLLAGGGHPSAVAELSLLAEIPELEWRLRLHDRSAMTYLVHLLVLRRA
jgi:SAM-dependent methyltransferase